MTTLEESSDVSLVELFGLLYRRRSRLLSAAAIAAVVSGIIVFVIPVSYWLFYAHKAGHGLSEDTELVEYPTPLAASIYG